MSWQEYVDNQLIATGAVSKAAILGHDGSTWAATGLKLKSDEGRKLAGVFANPSSAQSGGVFLEGVKYMCLGADSKQLNLKKGPAGATIMKTKQTIIVALYDGETQPGQNVSVVGNLADYLTNNNY